MGRISRVVNADKQKNKTKKKVVPRFEVTNCLPSLLECTWRWWWPGTARSKQNHTGSGQHRGRMEGLTTRAPRAVCRGSIMLGSQQESDECLSCRTTITVSARLLGCAAWRVPSSRWDEMGWWAINLLLSARWGLAGHHQT